MKKGAAILAGLMVLGGAIAALNLGETIPLDELRAARVPCDKILEGDCPAGIAKGNDFCLCLTNKETLPDEETTLPAARKIRLVVCEIDDPEAGKHLVTRYESSATLINKDCCLVADDVLLPGISMHNVSTGIESKLEAACAPCKITPDSWGPCPECAYRGDCDKLCPEVEDGL
jgi:hypothetical protein